MRFYATRTEAIQRTYSALQQLDQRRKGSPNPSRAIRVATFYGHLHCRANAAGCVQLALRELASSWHLQPRLLREDLADLQALGWLNFRSDAFGTRVQLQEISDQPPGELEPAERSRGDQATAELQPTEREPAEPQAAEREPIQTTAKPATTPSQSQLIAQFAALYNQHKPKSWPAYSPNGNSLAARLQRAIRHAGGAKAFDQVLIQALQAMPEFWRSVYPQGRTGGACVAALLSGDRSTSGLGIEFWHVFSWGATGSKNAASAAGSQGSSSVESDPDFRRACRLFVWGDHAWRGQGMEAFELPDQEKQRLTELLEAAGLGSPGQAAKQFAPSANP